MDRIVSGARVKLTGKAVCGYLRGYHRKAKIDWIKRRGTLQRSNRNYAYILWDDNKTVDQVSIAAVEREDAT